MQDEDIKTIEDEVYDYANKMMIARTEHLSKEEHQLLNKNELFDNLCSEAVGKLTDAELKELAKILLWKTPTPLRELWSRESHIEIAATFVPISASYWHYIKNYSDRGHMADHMCENDIMQTEYDDWIKDSKSNLQYSKDAHIFYLMMLTGIEDISEALPCCELYKIFKPDGLEQMMTIHFIKWSNAPSHINLTDEQKKFVELVQGHETAATPEGKSAA